MSDEPERADAARQHLAWLAHPVTLVALVLLLVNDHILKSAYPGLLTGKLSDVAGLVLAPALLASLVTLLARRAPAGRVAVAAVVAVGVGFAVVKAFPAAAALASAAWSVVSGPSVVRPDLTDLLTLPALGLAWLAWTRSRGRPAPGPVTRAVRLAVIAPVALAGVAATSVEPASVEYAVGVGPGFGGHTAVLVARIDDFDGREYAIVRASRDGRSWLSAHELLVAATPEQIDAAVEAAQVARRIACVDAGRCWRVVPGQLAVEESTDGGATWSTVWAMSGPERERYAHVVAEDAREVPEYHIDDLNRELACTNVSVLPTSGTVVVACGLAGFVSRDSSGAWTMLGFNGAGVEFSTDNDGFQQVAIIMAGLLILLIGAEVHALRHPRDAPAGGRQALAILIGFFCLLCLGRGAGGDVGFFMLFALMLLALLFVLTLAWLGIYLAGRRGFPWWTVPPAVLGPAIAASVHALIVRGEIYATPGWIGIWSVLALALAAAIVVGLLVQRPDPSLVDGAAQPVGDA